MAIKLPNNVSKEIKKRIFAKADAIDYGARSRVENGGFLNSLVQDEDIGGVLRQYMDSDKVRTYIKDGVLNAYAKSKIHEKYSSVSPEQVISNLFNIEAHLVAQKKEIQVYRSEDNNIVLLTNGTYLKWETALRKLLEFVAANPNICDTASSMDLCLVLAVSNGEMSFGDQDQIEKALKYIHVKAYFVK